MIVTGTGYVEVALTELSIPKGVVITCAYLRLQMPAVAGQEIELWVVSAEGEKPWEAAYTRDLSRSRLIGFVAEDGSGLVRFDLTDFLDGWSVEEQEQPSFYLRQRIDGDIKSLAPRQARERGAGDPHQERP